MSKTRRDRAVSLDRSRKSTLPCSSSLKAETKPVLPRATEDTKDWEDARCPVCMEHPHNAVLLICSSYDKGCRPYMCNTSQRHSNCLDQFCKSFAEATTATPLEVGQPHSQSSDILTMESMAISSQEEWTQALSNLPHDMHKLNQKLACPLCRGQVSGWIVVQYARDLMNTKTRSCACETCDFTGNYRDLRKHARVEHPEVKPTEPDPERQQQWRQFERQREVEDVLSNIQSLSEGDEGHMNAITIGNSLVTVFFVFEAGWPSSSWSGGSMVQIRTQLYASGQASPVSGEDDESLRPSWPRRRRVVSDEAEVESVPMEDVPLELDVHLRSWGRAGQRRVRRRLSDDEV